MRDDPFYSHAYSTLSLLYSDAYRIAFGRDRAREDNRMTALGLAQQAVKTDPNSSTAFLALHTAYWPLNKVAESFAAAEQGLALNPNNTQLRASYGARLCLRGEWPRGLAMLREAFAMNPALSDAYRYILALDRYRSGAYDDALLEVAQINLPQDLFTQVLLAMVNGARGDQAAARQAVQRIRATVPDFGDDAIAGFRAGNFSEDLIEDIAQGLARAGLELKAPPVATQ
jgi:adenylate cyclase